MTIEHACKRLVSKPWGVLDSAAWGVSGCGANPIGEIWYERPGRPETLPALLLKLLLSSKPLSIQVHPNDAQADAMGLPNGKTEAWYVVSAEPGSQVAIGLTRPLSADELGQAIQDCTIQKLVVWRTVAEGDVIFVPAGTIHAIGAGLVIAEIQQRSDTTFRLFDHGRQRDLHVAQAVAVADRGPAQTQAPTCHLGEERSVLVSDPHFVLERIDLPPRTSWRMEAQAETWLLMLDGDATIDTQAVSRGDALFAQVADLGIRAGDHGLSALVAYGLSKPTQDLLRRQKDKRRPWEPRPQFLAPCRRARITNG